MGEHIQRDRLLELAEKDFIFDEPEWEHMRACDECLNGFAQLVHQLHNERRPPDAKANDSPL
jgi:hypothetical protein